MFAALDISKKDHLASVSTLILLIYFLKGNVTLLDDPTYEHRAKANGRAGWQSDSQDHCWNLLPLVGFFVI